MINQKNHNENYADFISLCDQYKSMKWMLDSGKMSSEMFKELNRVEGEISKYCIYYRIDRLSIMDNVYKGYTISFDDFICGIM